MCGHPLLMWAVLLFFDVPEMLLFQGQLLPGTPLAQLHQLLTLHQSSSSDAGARCATQHNMGLGTLTAKYEFALLMLCQLAQASHLICLQVLVGLPSPAMDGLEHELGPDAESAACKVFAAVMQGRSAAMLKGTQVRQHDI